MSSPNEPGQSTSGDRPENGANPTETPPWQNPTRPRPESSTGRPAAPPAGGGSASGEAGRHVTGYAAPDLSSPGSRSQRQEPDPARAEPRTERTEIATVEPYPSELPDLSGPPARAPQPRKNPVAEVGRPPVPTVAPAAAPAVAPAQGLAARLQVGGRPRGPVRASMQIRRIDPWSALKVSLLLNVALFFVWMIAVAFLYLVLGAMGVWNKLNSNVGDLLSSTSGGSGGDLVSAGSIFGSAALIGLVNIVLLTAMAAIGAYIYNLSTDIVGGVEVTLADLD
ncbi:MAG: DUF3566 domain-containing protein [Mycobacterium sp.]|nr:DUF3566 domain-containing protein [Mycobacterium sp.]